MHKLTALRRKEKIKYPQIPPKPKKKLTCWQKCRRRLCRRCRIWLCRKVKKCFKRLIFGKNDPNLKKIKLGGFGLGKIIAKNSADTLYGSKKQPKAGVAIKDAIADELDAYSLSKSTGHKVKSYVYKFRENYLDLSLNSKLKLNGKEEEKFRSVNDKYVKKNKSSVITLFRNKKKSIKSIAMKDVGANAMDTYSLNKTQSKRNKSYYVDNLRENNLYLGLSKDSKLNLNAKDKERFKNLAEIYEKKNKLFPQKDLEFLEDIVKVKRKFSLTPSKGAVLQNMVEDYKLGKFSFSKIPDKSKLNIDTFDKKDLSKILAHYESEKKKQHIPYIKQSKLKQLKSDLRDKINFL